MKKRVAVLGVMVGLILNAGLNLVASALTVSTTLNTPAIDLVNNVLGEGITATSASRTGTVYAFSGGAGTFGIDSGIMLDTSGRVSGANDADLASLMDYTYGGDTSTLEFELTSTGTLLNFNYVFASREFDQPVKYNDVFGLFVSVNGGAYENIALIERNDGVEVPVTINSLRAGKTGTEAPSSFTNYPVNGHQYSLFKGAKVNLNETTDGVSNVFTAFKEVSVGDTVRVKFAIADVSDAKYDSYVMIEASSLSFEAPGARPNYFTENLWNLDPNTTYKITLNGVDYTVTTDENGETPIVTNDYDLFGHTIQITKTGLGQTAQTLKIAARPEPPDPVAGPDENYALPETVMVTETSITVVAEDGQQYRIDEERNWRNADENGLVVFSGLEPNVPHTVYTRYEATENHPASFSSEGTEFSTLRSLDYMVQNYWGLYDGQAHSAEASTEVGTVYYSSDPRGEFSLTKPEFTEIGEYPVYFLIRAEGYYSVYGTLSVEIVGWEYNLSVTTIPEVAGIKNAATNRERIGGYYEGTLNKMVDGQAVERVYEADEALTVTTAVAEADGEYQVVVLAEDGTTSRVVGTVADGVLSFQTNHFGKYGLMVPLLEMTEGTDYAAQSWSGLYDGEAHKVTVTSENEVTYATSRYGEYTSEVPTYIEPGVYTTYFKVSKDGYLDAYGEAAVEIIDWTYGLVVSEVPEVAELAGAEFYYAGEVNKMVNGEPVERVYATEEAMTVTVAPEVVIEGQAYQLKDGEYTVSVLSEDGSVSEVIGTAVAGVLSFQTNQFGKYGVVVPHEAPNADVDYDAGVLTELEPRERYKICYDEICVVVTADENGVIPLEGDDYDLYGQDITITKIGIAQDSQELTIGWRTGIPYQVASWKGLYDGFEHSASVTGSEISVKYMDEDGEYTLDEAEFVEPGVYPVKFMVTRAGYEPDYGESLVEIVEWTAKDTTDATTNYGGASIEELSSDELKEIIETSSDEDAELVENPEVKIWLTVEDASNVVTFAEMSTVRNTILSSEEILAFFDVNLFKQVGELEPEKIHETSKPLAVTISPELMVGDVMEIVADGKYSVVRLHEGVAEKIETETVEGAVKFETDKFSIYALVRPVISQEIDAPLPDEVDPLGVFDEIPVAVVALEDTPVIDESELDVPDTGAMVRNVAVAVATYLPAVILAFAMAVFMRNRRWAEMRRRAQASFNGGA